MMHEWALGLKKDGIPLLEKEKRERGATKHSKLEVSLDFLREKKEEQGGRCGRREGGR